MQFSQKISCLILVSQFLQHIIALVVLGVGINECSAASRIKNECIITRCGYFFDCVEYIILNRFYQFLAFLLKSAEKRLCSTPLQVQPSM